MPTSQPYQLNEIIELIILTRPQKVLDVGVGFGKYGLLSREYLELYDGREKYKDWKRQIDGIEVFKEYLTPAHEYIYDHIYIGNALEVLPTLQDQYDLILLIDTLEHFGYEEGVSLLEECMRRSRNMIISTPWDIGSQEESFNNPFEKHKFQWQKKHFRQFEKQFFVHNDRSLICYIGDDAPLLKHSKHSRVKTALRTLFPFLRIPYRAIMKIVPFGHKQGSY